MNKEIRKIDNKIENKIENIAAFNLDKYMNECKENCILVDVRDKNKYAQKHIDGAINIPYRDLIAGSVVLPEHKTIILYCDRGGLSMTAARYLSKKGYKVKNVVGGIRNYRGGKIV